MILIAAVLPAEFLGLSPDRYLEKKGLLWTTVEAVLNAVDVDELRAAFDSPEQFFKTLTLPAGPAAKKLAIVKLRPKLEP